MVCSRGGICPFNGGAAIEDQFDFLGRGNEQSSNLSYGVNSDRLTEQVDIVVETSENVRNASWADSITHRCRRDAANTPHHSRTSSNVATRDAYGVAVVNT